MPAGTISSRALAAVAAAVALLVGLVAAAPPAAADHDVQPARVEGDTRYDTAAQIAALDHPDGSGVVLLASGEDFPDALAAAAYARPTAAPVLLTASDELPGVTAQALADLGAQQVVILGGTAAVSQSVEDQLDDDYEVDRVDGDTRFETAAAVADRIRLSPNADIGELDGLRTAILVNAFSFADAVSAGPLAAGQSDPFPIVLTEHAELTATTEAALGNLGIEQVVVVGGEAAVSTAVEQRLRDLGYETERVAGADRSATSTQVASFTALTVGLDVSTVHLARGDDFADALAAGPSAGRASSPVLLTPNPSTLGVAVDRWLRGTCPDVSAVRAVGGTGAITGATLQAAVVAAEACHEDQGPQSEQTFLVEPQEPIESPAGSRMEIQVGIRYDDQPFTGPVNVAIVPCAEADVVGAGPDTFSDDADDNNVPDGFQTSDTGEAAIIDVNQRSVSPQGQLEGVGPDEDGSLEVGLIAEGADCVVTVVYDDLDGDDLLDIGDDGVPVEPYGVAQLTWTEG